MRKLGLVTLDGRKAVSYCIFLCSKGTAGQTFGHLLFEVAVCKRVFVEVLWSQGQGGCADCV